jgi:uncharacterized protein YecT (DUF1311 family)
MPDEGPRLRRQPNWTTIALIAGLVLLLLLVVYFATNRNSDQDKLTGNEMAGSSESTTPEKACASQATYNLIKRELFRRAAQLRGSDQAAYDKLSAVAVLRMENPVMESEEGASGGVNCSGSLSLDLPPGIAAVGGRKTLMSDVDYTVQPAADGSGTVVLLRNADSVIAPLATLARVGQAPAPAATPVITGDAAPQSDQPPQPTGQTGAPAPSSSPAPPRTATARPSFDCSKARTKGEIAVCSDSGLAALDANMAAQYRRAINSASPQQQAILQSTRDRFLGYRDRCTNRQCIGDAYVGRMREIRDIMEGRWQPER